LVKGKNYVGFFLFSTASKPVLGSTRRPI